jgi:hypothetical protein
MPSDPNDLASTAAPTAGCRGPIASDRALAVSAAAVTDHVCDRWHGRSAFQTSVSRSEEAHSRVQAETPRNLRPSEHGGPPDVLRLVASAELTHRVELVLRYPPLAEMTGEQRLEFDEALLDADRFEDLPGKWQAAILKAEQSLAGHR